MKHIAAWFFLALMSTSSFSMTEEPIPILPDAVATRFPPTASGHLFTLSGSNTIGARLAPEWAQAFLEHKGAKQVRIELLPTANEFRVQGYNGKQPLYIDILAHGSGTGFESLKNKSAAIAMSSRPISALELNALHTFGDLTQPSSEHVVAIDGLAVIVHPRNPVRSLSVHQIARIFSGNIRNWRDLGGLDQPIQLYARDQNSGTWDSFNSLVLRNQFALSANALRFESNDVLSDRVAENSGGIGFVGLASVRHARALAIIDGETLALPPERLHVATEDYPLARRLYLYSPNYPFNEFAEEFIAFAQNHIGQNIVEQVGYVSQNPYRLDVSVNEGPEFYRQLADEAQRLSVNFRFQPGSAELDNKGKRDIQRLADYLKLQDSQKLRVQLVGFSNEKMDSTRATILSKLRATAVKSELFNYGIQTETIEGFGDKRLVADTQGLAGSRNDRVEVWIYASKKSASTAKSKPAQTNDELARYAIK